uniref:Uncharacterized protein n=1 Tax=Strigamia maritima TaxID=126957 RepID=T1IU27_STRMM
MKRALPILVFLELEQYDPIWLSKVTKVTKANLISNSLNKVSKCLNLPQFQFTIWYGVAINPEGNLLYTMTIANKPGPDLLQTIGLVLCKGINFNDKDKTRECQRKANGLTLPLWYNSWRTQITSYGLNADAKKTIRDLADQCKNANDNQNFFPCLLEKFKLSCPEIYDFYRGEVIKIGYDV